MQVAEAFSYDVGHRSAGAMPEVDTAVVIGWYLDAVGYNAAARPSASAKSSKGMVDMSRPAKAPAIAQALGPDRNHAKDADDATAQPQRLYGGAWNEAAKAQLKGHLENAFGVQLAEKLFQSRLLAPGDPDDNRGIFATPEVIQGIVKLIGGAPAGGRGAGTSRAAADEELAALEAYRQRVGYSAWMKNQRVQDRQIELLEQKFLLAGAN